MRKETISVCVPTYNRPNTLKDLITTFQKQDYPYKELVISDDSSTDNVRDLIKKINDPQISYHRNKPGLGFPKNLLNSMLVARGKYLIILGDDDIFVDTSVLRRYVETFQQHKDVGFIYSNQIQFNNQLNTEFIITKFPTDTRFKAGKEAITSLFIHSIFIGGLGFRAGNHIKKLYPSKELLHPQVQLVGSILAKQSGFGLSTYAIGVRSHDDQIIFRALKDKKIKREGKHMNIELVEILRYLKKEYRLRIDEQFLIKQLVNNYPPVIIKEKILLGNEILSQNYQDFISISEDAKKSVKLKLYYLVCLVTPGILLSYLRYFVMWLYKITHHNKLQGMNKVISSILS